MFFCLIAFVFVVNSNERVFKTSDTQVACENGFQVGNHCLEYCPTGFLLQDFKCHENSALALNLEFSQDFPDEDLEKVSFSSLLSSTSTNNEAKLTERGLALQGSILNLNKRKISLAPEFTIELNFICLSPGTVLNDQKENFVVWISENFKTRVLNVKVLEKTEVFNVENDWVHVVIGLRYLHDVAKVKIGVNGEIKEFEIEESREFSMKEVFFELGKNDFVGLVWDLKVHQFETRGEKQELWKCGMMDSAECLLCYGTQCFGKCCLEEIKRGERKLEVIVNGVTIIGKIACPIFYSMLNQVCASDPKPTLVFSLETSQDNITENTTDYSLVASPEPPLYGFKRGKYFNGMTNFYKLNVNDGYFFPNLLIYMWIYPEHTTSISLFSGSNFKIFLKSNNITYKTSTNLIRSGNIAKKWSFLKIKMTLISGNLNLKVFIMPSISEESNFIYNMQNEDKSLDGVFYIGKDDTSRLFRGWMYLLIISNDQNTENWPIFTQNCLSNIILSHPCPELFSLGYIQVATALQLCPANSLNCKTSTDCNICLDPNCITCNINKYFTCENCINYIFRGQCFNECPYFTTLNSPRMCSLVDTTYSISFEDAIISSDPSLSLIFGANSVTSSGTSTSTGIPKSIDSRGTYIPPNTFGKSSSSYYFFPEFTQIAWVKFFTLTTTKIGFFPDNGVDINYGMVVSTSNNAYGSTLGAWRILVNKISIAEPSKSFPMVSHAIYYTRNISSNNAPIVSSFYDTTTSISRPKMSFLISTDSTSSFLIYQYYISSITNYDFQIVKYQPWRIESVTLLSPSDCALKSYIKSNECKSCNCIGCLNENSCIDVCPLNCRSCTSSNYNSCTACNSGFYLSYGVCVLACPLLSRESNGQCLTDNINQIAEWDFNVNSNSLKANELTFQSSSNNCFQYRRGWYTGLINVSGKFFLSPNFVITAWIKIISSMEFIRRVNSNNENEIYIKFDNSNTIVSLSTFDGQFLKQYSGTLNTNSWVNFRLGYRVSGNSFDLDLLLHAQSYSNTITSKNFFKLGTSETTTIGDGSLFWIYKMKIKQSPTPNGQFDDYNFGTNTINFSWVCGAHTCLDKNICISCSAGCNTCKFSSNCTFCEDPLCSECDLYEGKACLNCLPGAEMIGSTCTCKDGFYLVNGQCQNCNNKLCTACKEDNFDTCMLCKNGASLNAASDCVCSQGFYRVNDDCVHCPDTTCKTCSGTCTECQDGYYLSNRICDSCLTICATCVNKAASGCLTCKKLLNGICSNICPSYYTETSVSGVSTCSLFDPNGFSLIINKISKNFVTSDINLSFTYNDQNIFSLPRIAVNRGLLMNTHSSLTSNINFAMSNQFTLNFLIRPMKQSTLNLDERFFITLGSGFVSYCNTIIALSTSLDLQNWILISIKYKDLKDVAQIIIEINSIISETITIPSFYDLPRSLILSSNAYSQFEGWIYGISYIISIDAIISYDNIIKKFVLWSCDYNYANISGECKPCMASCTTCRYLDTCTLCSSPYCADCETFDSGCRNCIAGAINTEGICSCPAGYVRESSSCVQCHEACTSCENHKHIGCINCIKYLNGQCSTSCPTYTIDQNSICQVSTQTGFSLSFGDSPNLATFFLSDLKDLNFSYYNSLNLNILPIIGYSRGLFFNNSWLQLPSSFLLSNQFSIEIWAFSMTMGDIFNKHPLRLQLSSSQFQVFMFSAGANHYLNTVDFEILNKWNMYRVALSIENGKIKIIMSVDLSEQTYIIDDTFLDKSFSLMSIGSSIFKGWVYSVKYSLTSFGSLVPSSDNPARLLTTTWVDLSTNLWPCEPKSYFENNLCMPCLQGCITCRYDDTCSLCFNRMCSKCEMFESAKCLQCSSDSISDGDSCKCDQNKFTEGSRCNSCNPVCLTCTSSSFDSCLQCKKNLNSYCIDACPIFYDDIDSTCTPQVNTSAHITFDRIDRVIQSDNSGLTLKYAGSENLPLFGYQRGAYMNKTWLQSSIPAKFSNIFSIIFWVNTRNPGKCFEKDTLNIFCNHNGVIVVVTLQNKGQFNISLVPNAINSNIINSWTLITFSVSVGQPFKIFAGLNSQIQELNQFSDYFLDSLTDFRIGSGIIGWIYSFKYLSSYASKDMNDDNMKIYSLLWNCQPSFYFNGISCQPCQNMCNCRRPGDCGLCNDPFCDVCTDMKTSKCASCMSGTIWIEESNKCAACSSRFAVCAYNLDSGNSCKEPFLKNYDKTCLLYYGELDQLINGTCVHKDSKVFSFTFTQPSNVISSGPYQLYMGRGDDYWPKYDMLDPILLFKRGLFFNRSISTLGSSQMPYKLQLSNSHTFEIYLYLLGPGTILTLTDGKSSFISLYYIENAIGSYINLDYSTTDTNSVSSLKFSTNAAIRRWVRIGWSLNYLENKLSLTTYIDDSQVDIKAAVNSIFNQPSQSQFFLGGRLSGSFSGYIYKLSLYNYAIQPTESLVPCTAKGCPLVSDILSDCLPNQYPDPNLGCQFCRPECPSGCSGPINCNIHPDQLCKVFDSLVGNCSQCIDNTSTDKSPCTCADGAFYDFPNNTCRCPGLMRVYKNKCDDCTRWLLPSEVSGYFDSSFMQVIFNFSIPIIKTPCTLLFTNETLAKFGVNYICTLSETGKTLTLLLGKSNSLKNESVFFVDRSLRGIRQECGFDFQPISVQLKFSFDFPSPKAVIKALDTVFIKCQQLVVDGSLSTGKLLDDLQYKWEFVLNGKEMTELMRDFPAPPVYTLDPKLLQTGTLLVTLTVKNRFEFKDSTTAKIVLSQENAIKILFEQVTENVCKQSAACQFSIKSVVTCLQNPEYQYLWKVSNKDDYDEEILQTFWNWQTVPTSVKIPANLFFPTVIKFEVLVTDTKSDTTASASLLVKILPEDPVIFTDTSGGYISTLVDLQINSGVSNALPANSVVVYRWDCFLMDRPCKFQFTSDASTVLISKTYLQSRSLDRLSLTVSIKYIIDKSTSDSVSTSSTINLKFQIVSWEVMKVQIVEALTGLSKKVFKSSEKLAFKALFDSANAEIFTYNWEVEGKDDSIFSTPTDQMYVGIDPTNLVQGTSYHLTLTMATESGLSNSYFYEFKINSPPKFGVFSVNPDSGIELETDFSLVTNDWKDEEENYPLQYAFGYIFNSQYYYLTPATTSNSAKLKLAYKGDKIILFAKVIDSLGDYSQETFEIKMTMKQIDTTQIVNEASSTLDKVMFEELPNTMTNIVSSVLNRDLYTTGDFSEPDSASISAMQTCVSVIQDYVGSYMENSVPSKDLIDLTGSLLKDMTQNPYLRSEENFNKTSDLIHQLLNKTSDLGLDTKQAGKLLDSVDNSIQVDPESIYNKTGSMDSLHQVLNTLNSGVLKKMIPGQVSQVDSSQMSLQSTVISPSSSSNVQLKTSETAYVNVPQELLDSMGGKFGVSLSMIKSQDSGVSSQSTPNILAVSVFADEASESSGVQLKSDFFFMEVPVSNTESIKTPKCVYLNETGQWDSTGCSVVEVKVSSIVCKCSHLSFFSAGEGTEGGGFFPSNNFDQSIDFKSLSNISATSALGFYVCGAILVAYVIIAIIVGKKDAIDMKEVIKQIDEQNMMKVIDNDDHSEHHSGNDEAIMVDSINADVEMLEPKKGETAIVKTKVKIRNLILNHKFLKIFFLFDPKAFRLATCSMIFTVLLGKMYFIGLFYDGGSNEQATTIRQAIYSYTFRDFLVMFYSTVIMFLIELIIAYLTKNNMINVKWSKDENIRIIRWNRWRRAACLGLCWALMIWFTWSISMFAMNMNIGLSYKWIVTTITGYIGDFFFMPGFEYLFIKWIFPNLFLLLQLRFCFYKCCEKKKKKVTSDNIDDLASDAVSQKSIN